MTRQRCASSEHKRQVAEAIERKRTHNTKWAINYNLNDRCRVCVCVCCVCAGIFIYTSYSLDVATHFFLFFSCCCASSSGHVTEAAMHGRYDAHGRISCILRFFSHSQINIINNYDFSHRTERDEGSRSRVRIILEREKKPKI